MHSTLQLSTLGIYTVYILWRIARCKIIPLKRNEKYLVYSESTGQPLNRTSQYNLLCFLKGARDTVAAESSIAEPMLGLAPRPLIRAVAV